MFLQRQFLLCVGRAGRYVDYRCQQHSNDVGGNHSCSYGQNRFREHRIEKQLKVARCSHNGLHIRLDCDMKSFLNEFCIEPQLGPEPMHINSAAIEGHSLPIAGRTALTGIEEADHD